MLDSVLHIPDLKGLILETFGAGNAPGGEDGSLTAVIKEAIAREIIIVNVSQCQSGSVSPLYAPATVLGKLGSRSNNPSFLLFQVAQRFPSRVAVVFGT